MADLSDDGCHHKCSCHNKNPTIRHKREFKVASVVSLNRDRVQTAQQRHGPNSASCDLVPNKQRTHGRSRRERERVRNNTVRYQEELRHKDGQISHALRQQYTRLQIKPTKKRWKSSNQPRLHFTPKSNEIYMQVFFRTFRIVCNWHYFHDS